MGDGTAEVHVDVRVAAGSRAGDVTPAYVVPHQWTDDGIAVEGGGTGAHLLLTAVACCVLNDVYREAAALDVPVLGVAVHADGGFDEGWASTGIDYRVRVDTPADEETLATLLDRVEQVAEIPRVLRAGAEVRRT